MDIRRLLMHLAIQKETLTWIVIAETLILLVTLGGPLLIWAGTRLLGNTIEMGIETFDKQVLGVDVEIERISPNLVYGILEVEGLVVKNPENKGCNSAYLLKADHVHIDIDMLRLFLSRFKHVRIEKVAFRNVDVIYEKLWSSSNVQEVLSFLNQEQAMKKEEKKALGDKKSGKAPEKTVEKAAEKPQDCSPKSEAGEKSQSSASPTSKAGEKPQGSGSPTSKAEASHAAAPAFESTIDVTLHEVCIEDVGARAQAKMLGGRGFRIAMADIHYNDFSKEMGTSMVDDIVIILLKSVLKTVLANVIGKRLGDQCL